MNARFLVNGALTGAAVAFLLTNETVQRTVIYSAVRVWLLAQEGIEEFKERFRDAAAEVRAAESQE